MYLQLKKIEKPNKVQCFKNIFLYRISSHKVTFIENNRAKHVRN